MKLKFFSRSLLKQLHEEAASNLEKYNGTAPWIEALISGKQCVFESEQVVGPAPILLTSDRDDAENAKRIYTWLSKLTPAIAMEERLWSYLTHCVFADYMKLRWPADAAGVVVRRYLFEGNSFASLSRNGIARLWWAGYLTHDTDRTNPYELTETLFLRQDIHVSLLERSLGKCSVVRKAVLDFLRENSGWLSSEAFGKRIQLLLKELNLLGGVCILDALPESELQDFLKKVGKRLASP